MASLSNDKPLAPRLSEGSDVSTVSTLSADTTLSDASHECNSSTQNIRVVTRIRPLSTKELNEQSKESVAALESSKVIQVTKSKNFTYDAVFGPQTTQRQVYEQTAGDMIRNNLFKGFNVTVLAYGQTGSGKTHTIFGGNGMNSSALNEDLDGIIPRAVHDVFGHMNELTCGLDRMKVSMSYLEIYNEEARDLLAEDASQELQIRDNGGDVVVQNLSIHDVASPTEVVSLMESASEKRSTAATLMNAVSSRSHAICTLYITIAPLPDSGDNTDEITAKLTLVDLAGSERAKKTGAAGTRLKEGININKGLFVLGQVVSSLAELGQQTGSSDSSSIHVKYRDSKLTRLLQDSLGGNSKTVMVACVSPAESNLDETVNTLRYAERTRSIKNSAVRNVVATPLLPAEAAALRRENQMLKLQLFQAQAKISSMSSVPVTMSTFDQSGKSTGPALFSGNDASQQGIVDNELNGLNLKDLDIVTKLKLHCSSLEEKVNHLEEKSASEAENCLNASLRADKWQIKCTTLMNILKENNIKISEEMGMSGSTETTDIIVKLRKEIIDLREQLHECATDAEVSRSIAAAVVNVKGNVDSAETMAFIGENEADHPLNGHLEAEPTRTSGDETLSSELVAMSGSIDQKEEMIRQIRKERELMDSMRTHFECAIKSLQEEVCTLSSERDTLLSKIDRDSNDKDDNQTRRLRERTKLLQSRINDLTKKAAEHTRSLRMHSQAEKKCQKLEAELAADKKRRAELQRRLKKESVERRSEQKKARIDAAKLLRDSQKLKLELNKVKDAAVKQENVLRRKAAEAMHRQKLLAERRKKRGRNGAVTSDLQSQRKEEINSFIERELSNALSLQKLRDEIEENNTLLRESKEKRELVASQQISDEESQVTRSLDAEIDLRSKIIEQLERNIQEIHKAANKNPNLSDQNSIKFLEQSVWQGMNRSEIRYVSQVFFGKLVEDKYEHELLKTNQKTITLKAVEKAVEREKRAKEKEAMELKVQHSEDIAGLLESTKATVERDISGKIAMSMLAGTGAIECNAKATMDEVLDEYFTSYKTIGNKLQIDLEEIKASQEGMKRLVDDMADELISQNEAKVMLASRKKKSKKTMKVQSEPEDVFETDDDIDELVEDGDDSDWSPDTPMPSKKKPRPSMDDQESTASPKSEVVTAAAEQDYSKMTVLQLKALLRQNGLTVSGKKAELIERLKFYGNSKAREVVTASARKRARPNLRLDIPDTATKRLRLKSPVPTRKISPAASVSIESRVFSSRKGQPSIITSSTKASKLRRRTPTEDDTALLVTKRSSRKPTRATSADSKSSSRRGLTRLGNKSVVPSSDSSTESKESATRMSARALRNQKTHTTSSSKQSRASAKAATKDARKPNASKRGPRTSNESTNSITSEHSSCSTQGSSKLTSRSRDKKENVPSSTRSVASKSQSSRSVDKKGTAVDKKGTPVGRRKQRVAVLSSITNSAKKRRIDRRHDMAKSVNAAVAELERLNNAI